MTTKHIAAALASLTLVSTGCMTEDAEQEAVEIAESIEQELGGLDFEDTDSMFGARTDFELAGESDDGALIDDAVETDAEVIGMLGAPDAVLFHTTAMWGQIPGDRDNDRVYNWTGALSVNRGAIIARSTLRFDGRDRLLPRDNPRVIAFRSITLPHRDGLRFTIVDPTPEADEPLVLTYTQVDGDTFSAPISALIDEPQSREMDDAGNRIVIFAMPQAIDICQSGFLMGRWHKVAENRGRILGRVVDGQGDVVGHMRGVYGQRDNGDKVFFAKYINRDGQAQGILAGSYDGGHFQGRWHTRDGERGAVRGEYRETLPGPRVGGHFLGRWAETSCNLDR